MSTRSRRNGDGGCTTRQQHAHRSDRRLSQPSEQREAEGKRTTLKGPKGRKIRAQPLAEPDGISGSKYYERVRSDAYLRLRRCKGLQGTEIDCTHDGPTALYGPFHSPARQRESNPLRT